MREHEDARLKSRAQNIIQQQAIGKIVIDSYHSGLGLPSKDDLGEPVTRAAYPHDYALGPYGWLDYDRDSGLYVFVQNPDSELLPALQSYQALRLAESVVDAAARTITIQVDDTQVTFTAAPVWEDDYVLLRQINEELGRKNTGIVVWKLVWQNESRAEGLYAQPLPMLRNAHTYIHLTGYAYDEENGNLVYAGTIGYKTSIESIRATLLAGKAVSFKQPGEIDFSLTPLDRYEYTWQTMPQYTSHHACFVARAALPGKWQPGDFHAYLLAFHGEANPQQVLRRLFIERLAEALEFPVLEAWGNVLWAAANRQGFITPIETGGDCTAGVRFDLQANWKGLVEEQLESATLSI